MNHVIITGASSGLGSQLVLNFLNQGFTVWACVFEPDDLPEIREKFKDQLKIHKIDFLSELDFSELCIQKKETSELKTSLIDDLFYKVSAQKNISQLILINNAGVTLSGPIEVLSVKDWKNIFDVNFFSAIKMIQTFIPLLRLHKGHIINMGSVSGRVSLPFMAPYASSKFALRSMTDSLRRELQTFNIQVTLIEPGALKTPLWTKVKTQKTLLFNTLSSELKSLYQEAWSRSDQRTILHEKKAEDVSYLVEAINQVVTSSKKFIYHKVTFKNKVQILILKLIPEKWLDSVLK